MNNSIPDWNYEADFPVPFQKKPMGPDHELVELLWRNGQIVLNSQTQRRQNHPKHDQSALLRGGSGGGGSLFGNSSNLIHDDETVSWIQYPLEDSFEKEFCSNFFSELPPSDPVEPEKPIKPLEQEKPIKVDAPDATTVHVVVNNPEFHGNPMPPPRVQIPPNPSLQKHSSGGFGKAVSFPQISAPLKGDLGTCDGKLGGKGSGSLMQGEARECSVMTVGSSHCGSNQLPNDLDSSRASSNGVATTFLSAGTAKDDVRKVILQSEGGKTETLEPTLTSSSGGSGSSLGRTCKKSTGVSIHKRKSRDAEESECQSEAAELESAAGNKPAQRSGSARRSRAAEVHNLSERRRRDRINEKMRALQELIPHCNKTDKASMLDEAIEYLKSLQLQLQVMWMGSRMAPIMFPGVQHYMSRMGMGMGPPLPSIPNPMHLSRVPLVDQSMSMAPAQNQPVMCQTPMLNPVNYQNQMQNHNFSDQYTQYMGFHQLQTASQPMNMFRFGSQTMQQSQAMAPVGSGNVPSNSGVAANDVLASGKIS